MKSLVDILEVILQDCSVMIKTPIERDLLTIRSRVKHEGMSFLTITLPTFAKDFEKSLEQGRITPNLFLSFNKNKEGLPKFLQGFLECVFDSKLVLKSNPKIEAVDAIRQVCYFASKIRLPCTDDRLKKAIVKYKECENDVRQFRVCGWPHLGKFLSVFNSLFEPILSEISLSLNDLNLLAKHGPGATSDHTLGNQKYNYQKWTSRLERKGVYPDSYLGHDVLNYLDRGLEYTPESPVRVVFVPKTQKSPRVIAIEPVHNQYVQQAIMRALVGTIKKSYLSKSLPFDDQSVNGTIALVSSRSKKYATIDMSEASDRVPASLVHQAFANFPELRDMVFACRSKAACLPTGEVIPLSKFASMGSALCFPVESMIFLTLCVMSEIIRQGLTLSTYNIRVVAKSIHVFGDDICITSEGVEHLIGILHTTPLRVNYGKTFYRSNFRESCGVDAFDGHRVTPIYVREVPPTCSNDVESIVSFVETSNLFYTKGFWKTSQYLRDLVSRFYDVKFMRRDSSAIRFTSFQNWHTYNRYDPVLQRPYCKTFAVCTKKRKDATNESSMLLKFFTEAVGLTAGAPKDYFRSSKRNTMRIVLKNI